MAGDTQITVVGNVVNEVELRFTASGAAVAKFRVASTPRKYDKQNNVWVDGEAMFLSVNCWRQLGENVAESITKGMRVIVQGNLIQRNWDKDGEKRSALEIDAEEVAPSLRMATAKVTKSQRQQNGQQVQQPVRQSNPTDDPWATPQAQQPGWGAPGDQNPPF